VNPINARHVSDVEVIGCSGFQYFRPWYPYFEIAGIAYLGRLDRNRGEQLDRRAP